MLSALAGYFCSQPEGPTDAKVLVSLTVGTALAAGGCGALNMWWESEADARMERTRHRPIPAKLIHPGAVLLFGGTLAATGVTLVWLGANALAGFLTLATIVSYLLLYTPLKSLTSWCTLVGSLLAPSRRSSARRRSLAKADPTATSTPWAGCCSPYSSAGKSRTSWRSP